jgi:hypothetical protein
MQGSWPGEEAQTDGIGESFEEMGLNSDGEYEGR